MTPKVEKLVGHWACEHEVQPDKWSRLPGEEPKRRPCKFPAKWSVAGEKLCTRHGGEVVLNMLTTKHPAS